MTTLLFICHGNICRSTMAEFVMKHLVKQVGFENEFFIDSAATSTEAIGLPVDPRTVRKLKNENIEVGKHRAKQVTIDDYNDFDYLIIMDELNRINLERLLGKDTEGKVHKLLEFSKDFQEEDIADPWYTGNFDLTFTQVMSGCKGLLQKIKSC